MATNRMRGSSLFGDSNSGRRSFGRNAFSDLNPSRRSSFSATHNFGGQRGSRFGGFGDRNATFHRNSMRESGLFSTRGNTWGRGGWGRGDRGRGGWGRGWGGDWDGDWDDGWGSGWGGWGWGGCWNCGWGWGWGLGWGWGGWGGWWGPSWGLGWGWGLGWDPWWNDPWWGWDGAYYNYYNNYGPPDYNVTYPPDYSGDSSDSSSYYSTPSSNDYSNDNSSNDYQPNDSQSQPAEQGTPDTNPVTGNVAASTPTVMIYLKDGTTYAASDYWVSGGKLHFYVDYTGESSVDFANFDLQKTVDENAKRGVRFTLKTNPNRFTPSTGTTAAPPANSAPAGTPSATPSRTQSPTQSPAQTPLPSVTPSPTASPATTRT